MPHLSPHQAHTSATQGLARPPPVLSPLPEPPFLGLSRPLSQAGWQPGPEAESLVFASASTSGTGLGTPQGLGSLGCLAQHLVSPAHPKAAGGRGDLGRAPRGPEQHRLSPTPAQTQKTGLSMEGGGAAISRGSPCAGGRGAVHRTPNTHTPFFQGAWPRHPTDEPGAAPGSRQPLEPLSPPFPGCIWDFAASRASLEPRSPFPEAAPSQPRRLQLCHTSGPGLSRKQSEASKGSGLTLERPHEGEAEEAQASGTASRRHPHRPLPAWERGPAGLGQTRRPSPRAAGQRGGGGRGSRGSGSNFHPAP